MERDVSFRVEDRVTVEPMTALFRRPYAGGPGVVEKVYVEQHDGGDYLAVLLDSGKRRHPSVHQVKFERAR